MEGSDTNQRPRAPQGQSTSEVYPHPIHVALALAQVLGQISPLMLTPAWLALAAIASWTWVDLRIFAGVVSFLFTVVDGISLALLPRAKRSFGPVTPPLLALTLLRTTIMLVTSLVWSTRLGLGAAAAVQLIIAAASIYATWIEPFRLELTQAELSSPRLTADESLRLLHISDLHVESITTREWQLLDLVKDVDVDMILLTGDYLNLSSLHDPDAQADARYLLDQLCQRSSAPIYAITGSPLVDLEGVVPDIFAGLDIIWLLDEVECVSIRGHRICLVGVRCTADRSRDAPRLRRVFKRTTDEGFVLLLYHSPDLMPEAVDLDVDLYLCGHTHGGQLRLPLFGALFTSSAFWKRYEKGRYWEDGTTLYVSRGLGVEGLGAPRARFLSPPRS